MFTEMLDKQADEIERPPLLPAGVYVARVAAHPIIDAESNDNWEYLDFPLVIVAADEVDETDLEEYGNVVGARVRHRFMSTKDASDAAAQQRAAFNVRNFLENTLQCMSATDDIRTGLANAVEKEVMIELVHTPSKKPGEEDVFFVNINKVWAIA